MKSQGCYLIYMRDLKRLWRGHGGVKLNVLFLKPVFGMWAGKTESCWPKNIFQAQQNLHNISTALDWTVSIKQLRIMNILWRNLAACTVPPWTKNETIHASKAEKKDASFIFLTKLVILLKCTGHGRAHQNQRNISMAFNLKIINQASENDIMKIFAGMWLPSWTEKRNDSCFKAYLRDSSLSFLRKFVIPQSAKISISRPKVRHSE